MFGFGKKQSLDDSIFQLRFTAKQLEKSASKCEKAQNVEKRKVIKAISEKRLDFARLYAENAIRKKNESLNYLRLASRLDAVQSRIKTAQSMNQITKQMTGVVAGLDKAMKSMNLEQISQIMEKFESQFEDLDVHSKVLEDSMGSATTVSTPQSQVDALIQQVADENGLEMISQVDQAPIGEGSLSSQAQASTSADADLERRLRAMRN
ncbi:charged multivesicular body protein 1a-like [Styela clava]|uniref:charged multivesicular body protein 1a-like n=1 Tax=Styela clava TaxID=7725 RepID=UPI0019394E4F|nr:charged multivesicular body protein 1a-like [Styela clava]